MSTFKIVGGAAALSILGTMPALAQEVISNPGYCAFFYPNANCQNKGPGNPYTDPNYYYQRDAQHGWWNGPAIGPAVGSTAQAIAGASITFGCDARAITFVATANCRLEF